MFPAGFTVYRRDRETGRGGGVFLLVKADIPSSLEPDLNTECEILWVKLTLESNKFLHIGSFYRAHVDDAPSIPQLHESLDKTCRNKNRHIILAGDFNLPGWDWRNHRPKDNCTNPTLHRLFTSMMDDYALQQMVFEPTRGPNTLDLIFTNNPSLINNVKVLPGISDHDCCAAELNIAPKTNTQTPRLIPLYNRAD